jgi:hypothetical protein
MSGVIGDACFGQCGFNLDNPFDIKFNWNVSFCGNSFSVYKCKVLTPLI